MLTTGAPFSHIASACGFRDQAHLSKYFLRPGRRTNGGVIILAPLWFTPVRAFWF